jgi:energy-coupling factor transporter ATP-binding protein EcfA2
MNEQLIVKNFGPIKDATVDFKRVTVFIGPTGGGKSTLAKLAAVFRENDFYDDTRTSLKERGSFAKFVINNFFTESSTFDYTSNYCSVKYADGKHLINLTEEKSREVGDFFHELSDLLKELQDSSRSGMDYVESSTETLSNTILRQKSEELQDRIRAVISRMENERFSKYAVLTKLEYIPAERIFIPTIEYSWAGLMRDDIGLPKALLEFANGFSLSRKEITELNIPFLNVKYLHIEGKDFIKIPDREEPLMLLETASGIQSVTPLLVLLEHLSRNTEQAQSFIIEEPELNLYPTAQQGLLNWLVEKCTQGENDLTITTHSPYILSSCNLLLEAYKVAQLRPDLEDEIAAIVPKACWLNPDEFAAYYVADGTVTPITDERTHLIGGNELDAVSGDISDSFRKLLRLQKQKQGAA